MPVSSSPHLSGQHMGKPTGKSALLLDVRPGPWQRGETRWWAATTQPCSTSAATPGQGPCGDMGGVSPPHGLAWASEEPCRQAESRPRGWWTRPGPRLVLDEAPKPISVQSLALKTYDTLPKWVKV